MTIIAFNRYWVIRWQWAILCALAAAFLFSLSLWQWSRATEKQHTLARIEQGNVLGPLTLSQLAAPNSPIFDGSRVAFPAKWIGPMVWLLDNRQVDGRIGYDVIIAVNQVDTSSTASARPQSSSAILVNLGWIAAPSGRDLLPALEIPTQLMIDGLFRVSGKGLLLGTNLEDHGRWPMRIQQVDTFSLAPYVKQLITSGVIYQQGASPFQIHYQAVTLPPERHQAYAVQWALLSMAVIVIALAASARKETAHDKS